MKHFKSLLSVVVFALALTVTSCMNNDPTQSGVSFGKVTSTFPSYSFKVGTLNMKPTNSSALASKNITEGDIVYFSWSYNSDEQAINESTKELNVLVADLVNLGQENARMTTGDDKGESYENATITGLNSNSTSYAFFYYDKNMLIVPVNFLAKEDLSKHTFTLVWNRNEITSADKELKLYLRHKSSEESPSLNASTLKAFDIEWAVAEFKDITGNQPEKITILANETSKSGSDKLEDAKEELESYSVDYKFDEK